MMSLPGWLPVGAAGCLAASMPVWLLAWLTILGFYGLAKELRVARKAVRLRATAMSRLR